MVRRRAKHGIDQRTAPEGLIHAMQQGGTKAASDGSSMGNRTAGWGAVVSKGEEREAASQAALSNGGAGEEAGLTEDFGEVPGADQSSWAAVVDIEVCIDNKSVLAMVRNACQHEVVMPRFGFGRFEEMLRLCLQRQHRAFWVPSHAKKEEWRPESSYGSRAYWRMMNEAADRCAEKVQSWQRRGTGT